MHIHSTVSSSSVPGLPNPPTAGPPKYKALLIGINYTSPAGDNVQGRSELTGPVNNAKGVNEALIEVFHYKEKDIFLMTDEEVNRDTAHWPSEINIINALQDLVRGASRGDAFVFFYAGHCGQQPATTHPNEVDGLDEYVITCDSKKILNNTLRQYLVDPLPAGSRLTAILDSCHSGTLLHLDHYNCHRFLRRRAQSFPATTVPVDLDESPRRHSLERCGAQLFRTTFSGAVTAVLAVARFKLLLAKRDVRPEQFADGDDCAAPTTPAIDLRPPRACGGPSCQCASAPLNVPLVISLSSCSDQQSTWEDRESNGKSMTTKLVEILRKSPNINVGDLDQQIKKCLSRMAFKRLREIINACKQLAAEFKMSPKEQETLKKTFTNEGLFELKVQTPQIGSMHCLPRDEQFIIVRAHSFDL